MPDSWIYVTLHYKKEIIEMSAIKMEVNLLILSYNNKMSKFFNLTTHNLKRTLYEEFPSKSSG